MSLSNTNNNMLFVPTNSFGLLEPSENEGNWFLQAIAGLKPVSSYGWNSNNYWFDENVMTFQTSSTSFSSYKDEAGTIFTERYENTYEENTDIQTNLSTINESESTDYSIITDTETQYETKTSESFKSQDDNFKFLSTTDTVESGFFDFSGYGFITKTVNESTVSTDNEQFNFDNFFKNIEKYFYEDGSASTSFDFTYDSVSTNLESFDTEHEKVHANGLILQNEDGELSIEFSCSTIVPVSLALENQNEYSPKPASIYVELEGIESSEEFLEALGDNYAPIPVVFEVVDIIAEYTGENDELEALGTEAITDDAGVVA